VLAFWCWSVRNQSKRQVHEEIQNQLRLSGVPVDRPGIITIDVMSRITFWDLLAQDLLGWTPEEAINHRITLIMPQEYWESHMHGMARFLVEGSGKFMNHLVDVPAIHKDGGIIRLRLLITMTQLDNGEKSFTGHIWKGTTA
jgi:PAS domain S-box-containing protein